MRRHEFRHNGLTLSYLEEGGGFGRAELPFGPAKRQAANQQDCLRWAGGGIDNPAPDAIRDAIRPHSPNRRGARRYEYVVSSTGGPPTRVHSLTS
jgi:hypothetical protein